MSSRENRTLAPTAAMAALLLPLLLPAVALAQGQPPQPLGDPFEIAPDPAGEQWNGSVARNPDGSFVVVWEHAPWIESTERHVRARRFDADGKPRGAGYQVTIEPVHRYTHGDPEVAATPGGGFVVAWESDDPSPYWNDVYMRVYDADAQPQGPPALVAEDPTGSEYLVGVAVDPGGQFAVSWNDYYGGYDPVWARVFESDGTPRTGDFVLETADGLYMYTPDLAASGPGEFVVGYSVYDWSYQGYESEVRAQKFDVDGNVTVPEFRVDEGSGASYYGALHVGSDAAGSFAVLWSTPSPPYDVRIRRFSAAGQPLGSEFVVGDDGIYRDLAVSPGGRSLVFWEDYWGYALLAQLWGPDGTPEGPPFEVVDGPVRGLHLRAALDASESPLFVWNQWRVNQGQDVLARRFQTFERVFLDGFESGDSGRWSSAQP